MKIKMTNKKNITIIITIILCRKNLLKITKNKSKNKKQTLTTRKQMLLTLKEMTKIKSKKKMNKTMIPNKMNLLMHRLVLRMLLAL